MAIAFVIEKRAVIFVGAGFGDDVDDAAARAAGFGGEAGGGDLKFLNGVLGKIGEGAADDFVVVVAAADGAVGTDFEGIGFGGIEIGGGAIAGDQISEFEKVPAVQRDIFDGAGSDLALDHRLSEFDGIRSASDGDGRADGGDFEFGVDGGGAAGLQQNIFEFADSEAGGFDGDAVGARS